MLGPAWHTPIVDSDKLVAIAVGGIAGAFTRWAIIELIPSTNLPWAILLVNTIGSLLLGYFAVQLSRAPDQTPARIAGATTGFCGALTTFSGLTVAVAQQLRDGDAPAGLMFLMLSLVAGLIAVSIGVVIARQRPIGAPS